MGETAFFLVCRTNGRGGCDGKGERKTSSRIKDEERGKKRERFKIVDKKKERKQEKRGADEM